jgi:hypothetical protein
VPEWGTPAQFAFAATPSETSPAYTLSPELRPEDGYAITLITAPVVKTPEIFGASVVLCGFGAKFEEAKGGEFDGCKKASDGDANEMPLITNPTRCAGDPPTTHVFADSWEEPGKYVEAKFTSPPLTGCEEVKFEPQISLTPTSKRADSPTGMEVQLTMPTEGLESPEGIAQANLANATVTLPAGMAVNPSAASGLDACSQAQLGMVNGVPNDEPVRCPESSKVGTVEVETPILADPLKGAVYVARQGENPFGSLFGLYLVIDAPERGILIKIAGKLAPDPATGRIVTSFEESPEAPFSSFRLKFASGNRAPLITPPTCGTYKITSQLSPWSAVDPQNPTAAETVTRTSTFKVSQGPNGGACPTGALEPKLQGRLADPLAGTTSPFTLRLQRDDGTQRFASLQVTPPPGLLAYLKGVSYCADASLASVPSAPGTAAGEIASPSCPAASRLGTVTVGAGAGLTPFY